MRFIKTYEAFNYNQEQYNSDVSKYGKEYADFMLKSSSKGEKVIKPTIDNYNKDMISDYIEYIGKSNDEYDLDIVVNNLYDAFEYINNTSPIILQRIIYLEREDKLNKNNLGCHYIIPDRVGWEDIIWTTGLHDMDFDKLYILTVEITKDMVDVDYMIKTNIEYSVESEITLKNDSSPKLINMKKYD